MAAASYELARRLPDYERYGLASQLRRAAASVPPKIAEGNRRLRRGGYVHFPSIVRSSVGEIQAIVELVHFRRPAELESLRRCWRTSDEVDRMLWGMIRALRR